jgi:hypothetical protein
VTAGHGTPIDQLARQHAPQVLAEALREARSRATAELTEQLTQAIIASAITSSRPPVTKAAELTPGRGLCVYAITRDHSFDPITIPDLNTASRPRLVVHKGLSLVVAEVDLARFAQLDADPSEDGPLAMLAREHDAVVRAVFEHEPVLPLRFGTIVSDEDAAVQLLHSRHNEVSSWLDQVAGHREWGIRVGQADAGQSDDVALDGLSGTEYLQQRQRKLTSGQDTRQRQVTSGTVIARHAGQARHRQHPPGSHNPHTPRRRLSRAERQRGGLPRRCHTARRQAGTDRFIGADHRAVATVLVHPDRAGGPGMTDPGSTSLVDLLDRVVNKGAVINGDVIITLAGIDLIRLDLRLLLIAIDGLASP